MKRIAKVAGMVALICFQIGNAAQYQTIELADVQLAKSVSATVEDPADVPIAKALVQEFTADWKTILRSTSTDVNGKFSFTPVRGKKLYFLQISFPGFDPLRFRLQIDAERGASLKLNLTVAT